MASVSDRPSVSVVRWIARILGTLIGFIAFFGVLQWLSFYLGQEAKAKTHDYLIWVGFILLNTA